MNERTLQVLEFDKIKAQLREYATTEMGQALIDNIQPERDFLIVQRLLDETDEFMMIFRSNKDLPLGYIADLRPDIERSKRGGTLSIEACVHIGELLSIGRKVKAFFENQEELNLPYLEELVTSIYSLRPLEEEIKKKIDDRGEFHDSASPTLRSIRSSIRSLEASLRQRLQEIIRSRSKMLSDQIVTIRNNRYVLPVKHEYRSAIGGIVHDQSSSGQTLFMEPRAVVQLNNNLQQHFAKEKQEIDRILQQLSQKVADHAASILQNMEILTKVDFIRSRAQLALTMKASKPELNEEGIIDLKRARHPLIPEEEAVANDIALGEGYTAIVITGPNTGGKTVTLKTIGLLTLMAQTGLHIPALEGSKLSVFDKVFADIGDEQSIEQNLSTFSSHMTNIVSIMEKVDERTLVLFDEISAGTDPQEGAALAMALLDEVLLRKARIVATTHYPELKAYGYNRDNVMNASMEFDVDTLRPTYRLLMGIPGKSNAFEISSRLGLNESIIQRAKGYLGVDSKNVENMISALENTRKETEKRLHEAEQYLADSESLYKDLKEKWQQFEKKRDKLYQQAEEKAKKALEQAREEAEIIVAEVKQMKDQTLWKEHEWIEAKKLLEEAQPKLVKEKKAKEKPKTDVDFAEGDQIRHRKLQQTGEIIEKKNEEEYIIQLGLMRVTAKKEDLEYIGETIIEEENESFTQLITPKSPIKPELDLRGMRYEDAMRELEAYIDQALMQNYPRVTIIHGHGTGALRKGVEKYLKTSPQVKSYRYGGEGEGGTGVTVVEL